MDLPPLTSPFDQEDIHGIHLASAPLALVLAQVRYPPMVSLAADEGQRSVQALATQLASAYPVFRETNQADFEITPDGINQVPGKRKVWLLVSGDENWQVSIGQGFLSLQTVNYENRTDFFFRFAALVATFIDIIHPTRVDRLGIRYFNRIMDPDPSSLKELFNPSVIGPAASPLPDKVKLSHCLTQALYESVGMSMQAQWGMLPSTTVVDPAMPPISSPSWVLDIDSFTNVPSKFDLQTIQETLRDLADQAYRCFRWAVTENYIERFAR